MPPYGQGIGTWHSRATHVTNKQCTYIVHTFYIHFLLLHGCNSRKLMHSDVTTSKLSDFHQTTMLARLHYLLPVFLFFLKCEFRHTKCAIHPPNHYEIDDKISKYSSAQPQCELPYLLHPLSYSIYIHSATHPLSLLLIFSEL